MITTRLPISINKMRQRTPWSYTDVPYYIFILMGSSILTPVPQSALLHIVSDSY